MESNGSMWPLRSQLIMVFLGQRGCSFGGLWRFMSSLPKRKLHWGLRLLSVVSDSWSSPGEIVDSYIDSLRFVRTTSVHNQSVKGKSSVSEQLSLMHCCCFWAFLGESNSSEALNKLSFGICPVRIGKKSWPKNARSTNSIRTDSRSALSQFLTCDILWTWQEGV